MASKLFLTLYAIIFLAKFTAGNVVFHHSFGFGIKDGFMELGFGNSIKIKSNVVNINDNNENSDEQLVITTEAPSSTLEPVSVASNEENFNTILQENLTATRDAMLNLQQELQPLMERNAGINDKVKIITRYLNIVNDALAPTNTDKFSKIQVLLLFPEYLDQLESTTADVRSLEHTVMKLLLTKHGLYELKRAVRQDLRRLDYESLSENLI